jgi:hypothetical protein
MTLPALRAEAVQRRCAERFYFRSLPHKLAQLIGKLVKSKRAHQQRVPRSPDENIEQQSASTTVILPSAVGFHERMSQRLKILNVVGARPNLPKIAPLVREMQRHPDIEPILLHTGQHYDEKLSDVFFRQMGIPTPHSNLEVGSGSHAVQTAEVLKRIEPLLIECKPDWCSLSVTSTRPSQPLWRP